MDGGILNGLVDPRLEADFDSEEMMRLIACAGASIRHSAKRRAKMSQVFILSCFNLNIIT